MGCWFGMHDMEAVYHHGGYAWDLWCDVGYECRRCGHRQERHEDHWENHHEEKGMTGYFWEPQP